MAETTLHLKPGQALAVVAHPDDETIWMGGTIARHKDISWTILVLCRKSDPDRMPKFLKAAKQYRARGIICDLEDEGRMTVQESIPKIQRIIRKELKPKKFDYIFSHGANGEYGHPRHIGAHVAVKKLLQTKKLKADSAFYFAYRADAKKRISNSPRASAATVLSRKELRAKRNVVKKLYGFSRKSFENVSCLPVETFLRA